MARYMTVSEFVDECKRRGLVPQDFEPLGETDREKMSSCGCRAQNGLYEKHGHRVPEPEYAPRHERPSVLEIDDLLTGGTYVEPEPPPLPERMRKAAGE